MARLERDQEPGVDEVVIQVSGCGVCHTDLGFYYEGVPTRHPLPLTLGHEISGVVVEAGAEVQGWQGRAVVVPAVIPCGQCGACRSGHGSICRAQIFPGNDVHGGFASHVVVPAASLCPVPDLQDRACNPGALELSTLSVIADAVSTPYQAVLRSGLKAGDLAIFVGVGGVGGFGVQIAAALGAHVVAIDIDPQPLAGVESCCVATFDAKALDACAIKRSIKNIAKEYAVPTWRHRIFETSGSVQGQGTAFGLLSHASYLSLVGYSTKKVELHLSKVMALDATIQGNWGCLPKYYPEVLEMVLQGKIQIKQHVVPRPLSSINQCFAEIHAHQLHGRAILIPDM